ncbi:hypothetical protein HXA35_15950 [Bacillus sp. A301a_S52]|nr:hypothetical protein [Bacillus sp. A301a_S52]
MINPLYPVIPSIGEVKTSSSYNVIPDKAFISGTARYYHQEVQDIMKAKIEHIVRGVATSFSASFAYDYQIGEPLLLNDPSLTQFVKEVASTTTTLPNSEIGPTEQSLGGEYFPFYSTKVPACYPFLGIGDKGRAYAHHHLKFDIDAGMLAKGPTIPVTTAFNYLTR